MKKSARDLWNGWIVPLIYVVFVWSIFHRSLEFGNWQSIVLTAFFAVILGWLYQLQEEWRQARDFEPYRVEIVINNWGTLLTKYKLMESEAEWEQVYAKAKESNLIRGTTFRFTVLSHDGRGQPRLLYFDDHKAFLSGPPAFSESIKTLLGFEPKGESGARLFWGHLPGEHKGYAMGLCVDGRWWNSVKTPDIADTETYVVPELFPRVFLVLARLPDGELELNCQRGWKKLAKRYTRSPGELAARGWKYDAEDTCWRHTHFSVYQGDLEAPKLAEPFVL